MRSRVDLVSYYASILDLPDVECPCFGDLPSPKGPLPRLQRDQQAYRFCATRHPFGVVVERAFAHNPPQGYERINKKMSTATASVSDITNSRQSRFPIRPKVVSIRDRR